VYFIKIDTPGDVIDDCDVLSDAFFASHADEHHIDERIRQHKLNKCLIVIEGVIRADLPHPTLESTGGGRAHSGDAQSVFFCH
jgi:hypothetical protein